jgi:hypothetical protein
MNSDPNLWSVVYLYDPDDEFEWVYREQAQRLQELLLSPTPARVFSPSDIIDQGERIMALYFIGECPFLSIYTDEGEHTGLSWDSAPDLVNYIEEILAL